MFSNLLGLEHSLKDCFKSLPKTSMIAARVFLNGARKLRNRVKNTINQGQHSVLTVSVTVLVFC